MIKNLKNHESIAISKMVNGAKQTFTYNYINEVPLNGNTNSINRTVYMRFFVFGFRVRIAVDILNLIKLIHPTNISSL